MQIRSTTSASTCGREWTKSHSKSKEEMLWSHSRTGLSYQATGTMRARWPSTGRCRTGILMEVLTTTWTVLPSLESLISQQTTRYNLNLRLNITTGSMTGMLLILLIFFAELTRAFMVFKHSRRKVPASSGVARGTRKA